MSLNCGIMGLPNVGKSTLFQALTAASAEVANYPFCTIEPNLGIVNVTDSRLNQLADIVKPKKIVPTIIEFVDIAGLVKGASKGEGLGNQFLGHIRQVDAIIHVVRCFEDPNIVHVHGKVSPEDDISIINFELCLADFEVVDKKLQNLSKVLKGQNQNLVKRAKAQIIICEKLKTHLDNGLLARGLNLTDDEIDLIKELNLITLKPMLYLCNVDEKGFQGMNAFVESVKKHANIEQASVLTLPGKLESEISSLDTEEEKQEFLEMSGVKESGLSQLTMMAYKMLNLKTYFTAGEKEVRAWTFKMGAKAPEAAGVIHSDFERGFIKAEVYHCKDIFELKSEAKVKESGRLRIEGKEYIVQDGDVIHFRFNV